MFLRPWCVGGMREGGRRPEGKGKHGAHGEDGGRYREGRRRHAEQGRFTRGGLKSGKENHRAPQLFVGSGEK